MKIKLNYKQRKLPPIANQTPLDHESIIDKQVKGSQIKPTQEHEKQQAEHLLGDIIMQSIEGCMRGGSERWLAQARDRRVIIKYNSKQQKFDLKRDEKKFMEWVGEMNFAVVSSSFELLTSKSLSYSQVKVYCCQNLILNLLLFFERVQSSEVFEVARKMDSILVQNLEYLLYKYPQAKEVKPNKKLREMLVTLNNIENDENDLISLSGVDFKLKKSEDYTFEIMSFINFLITKQNEPIHPKTNKTYFQDFYELMEGIFQSVEFSSDSYVESQLHNIFHFMSSQPQSAEEGKRLQREAKEYREKVRAYTAYKIDQKIKPETPLFTKEDLETGWFTAKSTAVLRIMAKWIEELERKIRKSEELILKRLFRFKNRTKGMIKLASAQKNELYQEAKKQLPKIDRLLEEIGESCFQIEGKLAASASKSTSKSVPKYEQMIGGFCTKVESAASSYLFTYLNYTIHYLLQIPKHAQSKFQDNEFMLDELNINLITFKVGDLFRCKCSSHESEIVRIYNILRTLSEKGDKVKIVRVKDRLEMGTRDILINAVFLNTFMCEIQLAVVDEIDHKQNLYDKFNHFLYELRRSDLGPVMESACIWAHFDQRAYKFKELKAKPNECLVVSLKPHRCTAELRDYNLAFVCTLCGEFYFSQSGVFKNRKCPECMKFYECRNCYENKMNEKELKHFLKLDYKLGPFIEDFKEWKAYYGKPPPKFGIIVPRKINKVLIHFYNIITIKNQDQIVVIKAEKAEVFASFRNEQKSWDKVAKNFIIFGWTENRFFNKTILDEPKKPTGPNKRTKIMTIEKDRKLYVKNKDQDKFRIIQTLCKLTDKQLRCSIKIIDQIEYCLLLQPYFRDYAIKEMIRYKYNLNMIRKMLRNKMELLFLEEQSITLELQYLVIEPELQISLLNIKQIYLDQNMIDDLSFVAEMPQLRVAHFNRNSINDYSPLAVLTKLTELMLEKNLLTYISQLPNCTSLTQFSLNSNKIQLLQNFANLISLQTFTIYGNKVKQIQGFGNIKLATSLDFSCNQIQQIQGLQTLQKLKQLDFSGNIIKQIRGLQNLTKLVQLDFQSNRIAVINGLDNLIQLRHLQLSDNFITKIQNLKNNINLSKLLLAKNRIKKIQNINHLQKLTVLDLSENQLKEIEGIENCSNLIKVDFSLNYIKYISELILAFEYLQVCQLSDNNIQPTSQNNKMIEIIKEKLVQRKKKEEGQKQQEEDQLNT